MVQASQPDTDSSTPCGLDGCDCGYTIEKLVAALEAEGHHAPDGCLVVWVGHKKKCQDCPLCAAIEEAQS